MAYAERTSVSPEKSRAEIEKLLRAHGVQEFASGWSSDGRALVQFKIQNVHVRLSVDVPRRESYKARTELQREAQFEQEVRRRWRVCALLVKAKLEAIASGVTTIEREFLADVVLPDNTTVSEWAMPQFAEISRKMPALLPGGSS
jgi:hypothetical protein